jgi:superfamily II DNA/RNA helicase
MRTDFGSLQHLVLNPSSDLSGEARNDVLLRRISGALRGSASDVAPADIAVLIRQALIACQGIDQDPLTLRVPQNSRWPDVIEWQRFGCEAQTAAIGFYFVKVYAEYPEWLAGQLNAIGAAHRAELRRRDRKVTADPAVKDLVGFDFYSSPGQQAAVRVALLMPPASTALVLLPTGAGKSLIFHTAALIGISESTLTIVVVPTVALAKDQELRYRELLQNRTAATANAAGGAAGIFCYHSGLSENERSSFRTSIAEGGVSILFASPESLLNSLRPSLFLAAQRGKLRYFVVDEVHMVAQWGEQFRPEFHMLAGLRDSLLAECPTNSKFRTLLLTATLTSDSYRTIRSLFSSDDFRVISELALRPEPRYVIEAAKDDFERGSMVEDALRLFPRPLLLYTSLREDADTWFERIRSLGFRRIRLVKGGDLSSGPGEKILSEWRDGDIDVMVATSAFGLGVDQNDVRSVVHACLPESIDRFYQEVGRSGRDGRASVSLLVTSPDDETTAKNLSTKTRISIDRGFERWIEMWTRRKRVADSVFTVSLDATPINIVFTGTQNASWNLRTLVLMRAAKLIDFFPHLPSLLKRFEDEEEGVFEARQAEFLKKAFREVAIRIVDAGHSDPTVWDHRVAEARKGLRGIEERSFAWTKELLDLKRPIQSLLREVYTVPELDLRAPVVVFSPNQNPGGHTSLTIDPEVWVIPPLETHLQAAIRSALSLCHDGTDRYWVSYDLLKGDALSLSSSTETITEVLRLLVAGGFLEFALPDWMCEPETWRILARQSQAKFVVRNLASLPSEAGILIPRVTMIGESDADQKALGAAMAAGSPAHMILFPTNLRDPRRMDRRISDVVPHISIHTLLSRLQA